MLLHKIAKFLPYSVKRSLSRTLAKYTPAPRIVLDAAYESVEPSPFWVKCPNPLTELGERYQPTKRFHNYLPYYWAHLRDIRFDAKNVLELGVQSDRSVRMWREFFPEATIHGLDVDPECKSFESERITVTIGDQSSPEALTACLKRMNGSPDVIIDDGSHMVKHQILSCNYLLPRLSDHGIYIIEDTGGCVEDSELKTVERFKRLVNSVFYWPRKGDPHWTTLSEFSDESSWADRNISGVAFYRWMIFVFKGKNPQDNPYLPLSTQAIAENGLAPYMGNR